MSNHEAREAVARAAREIVVNAFIDRFDNGDAVDPAIERFVEHGLNDFAERVAEAIADAALSAIPGWRLVPEEPTREMIERGASVIWDNEGAPYEEDAAAVYRAMISAAPPAAAAPVGEGAGNNQNAA